MYSPEQKERYQKYEFFSFFENDLMKENCRYELDSKIKYDLKVR